MSKPIKKKRVRDRAKGGSERSKRRKSATLAAIGGSLLTAVGVLLWIGFSRGGGWPAAMSHASAAGYNVLLVTLDTTRADHLGCYGYKAASTPALDALANEGIRFDDAVTVAPVTLPSHASILTGLAPHHHGVRNNGEFHLDPAHVTLAEILGDQNYQTAAFIAAFVLDSRYGLDQGFDVYDDELGGDRSSAIDTFSSPIHERSAARVTTDAVSWLAARDRTRPFFCWVHYFDPHKPYNTPPPFRARFSKRPYDGEIAYMDSQIGRLVQSLKKEDAWANTLIGVVADHGEGLGDHGEASHAKLIYGSVMRVPLIVACPGLSTQSHVVDDVVVSVMDIFPTVLDLLGVDHPADVDGVSLLAARSNKNRTVYMENLATYLDNGWSPLYGLRRHHDKFILAPRAEYYRLDRDPGELNNVYDSASGVARTDRDYLAQELSKILDHSASIDVVAAAARQPDAKAAEALRALGYAGFVADADPDNLPDPKDMMPVMKALDRADAMARAGRYEEALGVLKGAAAISPRDPRLLITTGKVYSYMDRRNEAKTAYRACLSIRETARVCVLLAQILLAEQQLDEAEILLDRAQALEPNFGGTYLARGDLFAIRRLPDEALAAYALAAEVDPHRTAEEAKHRTDQLKEIIRLTTPQP